MQVCLEKQLKEAEAILAEEDVPIDCSPPFSQELPKENLPEVFFLLLWGKRKCQGCKWEIIRTKCPAPKDLVLHESTLNMEGPKN